MSKLLKQYNELKEKDPNTIYMFKVGIFYIFINDDARLVSKEIGLKLTNLSSEIIKCGFPISSLEKYTKKLDNLQLQYKVIDDLPQNSNIVDYSKNIEIKKILKKISEIDMNNTTFQQAFNILLEIQNKLKNIK